MATRDAVIKRINRVLAKQDERLRTTRGEKLRSELGDVYRLDVIHNAIIGRHVNVEELGRELGVLSKSESVR